MRGVGVHLLSLVDINCVKRSAREKDVLENQRSTNRKHFSIARSLSLFVWHLSPALPGCVRCIGASFSIALRSLCLLTTFVVLLNRHQSSFYPSFTLLTHQGAGTILEALEAGKRMLVVVNDLLMDNHQTELASQMETKGYLCACTCATLKTDLLRLHTMPPKLYTPGEPVRAAAFISATLDEARKARFEASYDQPLLPFAVATVFALLMAILAAGLA
jgi:hypothetical protein